MEEEHPPFLPCETPGPAARLVLIASSWQGGKSGVDPEEGDSAHFLRQIEVRRRTVSSLLSQEHDEGVFAAWVSVATGLQNGYGGGGASLKSGRKDDEELIYMLT